MCSPVIFTAMGGATGSAFLTTNAATLAAVSQIGLIAGGTMMSINAQKQAMRYQQQQAEFQAKQFKAKADAEYIQTMTEENERKKKYLSDIKQKSQSSMFVSLCDKLHNGTSIVNDYKRKGKKVWTRFTATPKQVAWYYEGLYKEFSKHLKGHKVLKDNYLMVVKEIKRASSK